MNQKKIDDIKQKVLSHLPLPVEQKKLLGDFIEEMFKVVKEEQDVFLAITISHVIGSAIKRGEIQADNKKN